MIMFLILLAVTTAVSLAAMRWGIDRHDDRDGQLPGRPETVGGRRPKVPSWELLLAR
jgi:hypothetical protein